jgi:hypothetical protein
VVQIHSPRPVTFTRWPHVDKNFGVASGLRLDRYVQPPELLPSVRSAACCNRGATRKHPYCHKNVTLIPATGGKS